MAETQRFGLTKTPDNDILDRLLAHFEEHRHDGGGVDGLADPSDAPTAVVDTTGGSLANGIDLYYRVSFVDANGLETVASDELEVIMPPIPEVLQEPVPTAATVAGSTLPDNTYFYTLTANAPAGETTIGPQAIITVIPGQNHVDLGLPALPDGADSYNVWRMGTGEEGWTEIGATVTDTTFADTGFPSADCPCDPASQPPTDNYGTATNSVTITTPDAALVGADPSVVKAWRIYRTDTSGVYGSSSLLAQVATTTRDSGGPLVTSYVDTGGGLLPGTPNNTSTALHPSRPVVLANGAALPTDTSGFKQYTPFLLNQNGQVTLYALVDGAWELVAGGGGGGTAGGDPVLAFDDQPYMSLLGTNLNQALTPEQNVQLSVPDDATHLAGLGADVWVIPDWSDSTHRSSMIVKTAGDYYVRFLAYVTGLAAGDLVVLSYSSAFGDGYPAGSQQFIVPPGRTDFYADLSDTTTIPLNASVGFFITVFSAGSPVLDQVEGTVRMVRGVPMDAADLLPQGVRNLSVQTGNAAGELLVSFDAPTSSGSGGPVLDYLVTLEGGNGTFSFPTAGSHTLTLDPGYGYTVHVQARNERGFGPAGSASGDSQGGGTRAGNWDDVMASLAPLRWYKLGAGSLADSSVHAQHATITNGFTANPINGPYPNCTSSLALANWFTNSRYYMIPAVDLGGACTLMGWFYAPSFDSWRRIIDLGSGAASNNVLLSYAGPQATANAGRPAVGVWNGSASPSENTDTLVTNSVDNAWHLVVASVAADGTPTLYVDGVAVPASSTRQTHVGVTDTPVAVPPYTAVPAGTRTTNYIANSSWRSDGTAEAQLSNVAIFDRALSAADVAALWAARSL